MNEVNEILESKILDTIRGLRSDCCGVRLTWMISSVEGRGSRELHLICSHCYGDVIRPRELTDSVSVIGHRMLLDWKNSRADSIRNMLRSREIKYYYENVGNADGDIDERIIRGGRGNVPLSTLPEASPTRPGVISNWSPPRRLNHECNATWELSWDEELINEILPPLVSGNPIGEVANDDEVRELMER